MKSSTHRLTEAITTALGPLFHEQPDYTVIQQAMGLVVARIAMATPRVTHEHDELEVIYIYAKKALTELLRLEAEQAAQKKKLDEGIDGFAKLFADKSEPEVSADEFYRNSGLNPDHYKFKSAELTMEEFEHIKEKVIELHTPDKTN